MIILIESAWNNWPENKIIFNLFSNKSVLNILIKGNLKEICFVIMLKSLLSLRADSESLFLSGNGLLVPRASEC